MTLVDRVARRLHAQQIDVDFTDAQLADLVELGQNHNIDDVDDIDWPGEFGDFVPFAILSDAAADDDDEPVRAFLIMSVTDAACPVYLWDYDGWTIYPIAQSLDDFIGGVASGKRFEHAHASTPYKKYVWVADTEEDDE